MLYLLSIFLSVIAYYLIDNLWCYWLIGGIIIVGALRDLNYLFPRYKKSEKTYNHTKNIDQYSSVESIRNYSAHSASSTSWHSPKMLNSGDYFKEQEVKTSSVVPLALLPKAQVKELISSNIDDSWTKGRKFELSLIAALEQNKNLLLGLYGNIVDYSGSLVDKVCKVDVTMESDKTNFLFQCKYLQGFGYSNCKNLNVERDIVSKKYNNYFSSEKERGYIIVFDSKMKIFDKNETFVHEEKVKDVMDEYFAGINDGKGLITSYLFLDTETLVLRK